MTKVAPVRLLSMMMGVWLATNFTGGFLAGYIGSFWSRMPHIEFFLMIAAIAAGCRSDDPRLPPPAEGGARRVISIPPPALRGGWMQHDPGLASAYARASDVKQR